MSASQSAFGRSASKRALDEVGRRRRLLVAIVVGASCRAARRPPARARASTGRPACGRRGRRGRRRARLDARRAVGLQRARRRSSRSAACSSSSPSAAGSARAAARRSSPHGSRRAPCRAGRYGALPSPPRSAGTSSPLIGLPREESRCLLQDLPLLTQQPILAPQPAQLLPLLAGQALTLAGVDLRLLDPAAQRLAGDTRARARAARPASRSNATSRTASSRNSGGYGGLVLGTSTPSRAWNPKREGVNETGSTPTPHSKIGRGPDRGGRVAHSPCARAR